MEKRHNRVWVPWGVIAGIAVLVGWSLFSWRTAVHPAVTGGQIHVPKPQELGIVLPPEPAPAVDASPSVLGDAKKPVKVKHLRTPSERLMEKGLVPPPEETKRMEKKKIVVY